MNGYKIFRHVAGDVELVAHGWERSIAYDFLASIWLRFPNEELSLYSPEGVVLLSRKTAPEGVVGFPSSHDSLALYAATAAVVGGDETPDGYRALREIVDRLQTRRAA